MFSRWLLFALIVTLLVVVPIASSQGDATVEIVVEGLQFPEGPVWDDAAGVLYFVEYGGNRVGAFDGEETTTFIDTGEGSGSSGLLIDPDGNFWVANYETLEVVKYAPDGTRLTVIDSYEGETLRGPNDMTMDADGGLYFTDSGNFGADWSEGRLVGRVFYYTPEGELILVDEGLRYPNGIELSVDGSTLYVNEHLQNQVLAYTINDDGTYSEDFVFFRLDQACELDAADCYQLGPDGAYRTNDGTLYIAHYGGGKIVMVNPDGELLGTIPMPDGSFPTNIAMTPDEQTMFVTESGTGVIYRFDLSG